MVTYLQNFLFKNNDRINRRMYLMILTMVPPLICNKVKATLPPDCYTIMVIRYMIQEPGLIKVIFTVEAAQAGSVFSTVDSGNNPTLYEYNQLP